MNQNRDAFEKQGIEVARAYLTTLQIITATVQLLYSQKTVMQI